jgi:hypothetical protein
VHQLSDERHVFLTEARTAMECGECGYRNIEMFTLDADGQLISQATYPRKTTSTHETDASMSVEYEDRIFVVTQDDPERIANGPETGQKAKARDMMTCVVEMGPRGPMNCVPAITPQGAKLRLRHPRFLVLSDGHLDLLQATLPEKLTFSGPNNPICRIRFE